jgi:hypothetical protein
MSAERSDHPAITSPVQRDCQNPGTQQKPGRKISGGPCEAYLEIIEAGLSRGLNTKTIWRNLVDAHGFSGSYQSVSRFVRKLRANSGHGLVPRGPRGPAQSAPHGTRTRYRHRHCRCEACKSANRDYLREWEASKEAPAAAPDRAEIEALDGLARSLARKPFAKLDASERQAVTDIARKLNLPVPDSALIEPIKNKAAGPLGKALSPEINAAIRAACKRHCVPVETFYSKSTEMALSAARREAAIELRGIGFSLESIAAAFDKSYKTIRVYLNKKNRTKVLHAKSRFQTLAVRLDFLEKQVTDQAKVIAELTGLVKTLASQQVSSPERNAGTASSLAPTEVPDLANSLKVELDDLFRVAGGVQ